MSSTPHPRIEARHLDPELLPKYTFDANTEAHMVEPVLAAITAAVADCSVTAASTIAAHIYTRKAEQSLDRFGEARTTRYGSNSDDVFLQISVRVPHYAAKPVKEAIRVVETLASAQLLREAEERLEKAKAATAEAAAEEARIQAEIDRLNPIRRRNS